ncbi:hypothetical protein ACOJR9_02660 [Alteromonas sp. A081]|uniref:hypothetical protein n=1 Tax=Alteromonas sp. A081 TaxID=3410269 RepID=UPI003B982640
MRIFTSVILSILLLAAVGVFLGIAIDDSQSKLQQQALLSNVEFGTAPEQVTTEQQCETLTQQVREELFNNFKEYKRCISDQDCGLFDYSDYKCPLVIRKEMTQNLKNVLDRQLSKSCLKHSVKDGCWVSEFQCKQYRCVATNTMAGRGVPPPPRKQELPPSSVKDEF